MSAEGDTALPSADHYYDGKLALAMILGYGVLHAKLS